MNQALEQIVSQLFAIPIIALVGALVMRHAHVLAVKRFTTYGKAYLVTLLAYLAQWLTGLLIWLLVGVTAGASEAASGIATLLALLAFGVGFLVEGWTVGALFKDPSGNPIGFALGMSIVVYVVVLVVALMALSGGVGILIVGGVGMLIGGFTSPSDRGLLLFLGVVFALLGALGIRKLMSKYQAAASVARNGDR